MFGFQDMFVAEGIEVPYKMSPAKTSNLTFFIWNFYKP